MVLRGWRDARPQGRTQPTQARLTLEGLEDRLAPAGFALGLQALSLHSFAGTSWQTQPLTTPVVRQEAPAIPTFQLRMEIHDDFGQREIVFTATMRQVEVFFNHTDFAMRPQLTFWSAQGTYWSNSGLTTSSDALRNDTRLFDVSKSTPVMTVTPGTNLDRTDSKDATTNASAARVLDNGVDQGTVARHALLGPAAPDATNSGSNSTSTTPTTTPLTSTTTSTTTANRQTTTATILAADLVRFLASSSTATDAAAVVGTTDAARRFALNPRGFDEVRPITLDIPTGITAVPRPNQYVRPGSDEGNDGAQPQDGAQGAPAAGAQATVVPIAQAEGTEGGAVALEPAGVAPGGMPALQKADPASGEAAPPVVPAPLATTPETSARANTLGPAPEQADGAMTDLVMAAGAILAFLPAWHGGLPPARKEEKPRRREPLLNLAGRA